MAELDVHVIDVPFQALVGTFHEEGYLTSPGVPPTGGTFTITVDAQTTSAIAYNATAAAVQSALEALSNVAPGDVAVSLFAGGPDLGTGGTIYLLNWTGGAFQNVDPAVSLNTGGLTGNPHLYFETIRQTVTIPSGPGKTPKGVRSTMTRNTALDTLNSQACTISRGYYTGSAQLACGYFGENGATAANANAGGTAATGAFILLPGTGSPAAVAKAVATSLGTDSVTFVWQAGKKPAGQRRGVIRFWLGADVDCNLQVVTTSGSIGGTANPPSAPGFQLDGLESICVGQAIGSESNFGDGMLSLGGYGRSSNTHCMSVVCNENMENPTSSGAYTRSDVIAAYLNSAGGTVSEGARVDVTSVTSTTYELTTRNSAQSLSLGVFAYRIGGRGVWCGCPVLDTDNTTGTKSFTGAPFRPFAADLFAVRTGGINTINSGAGGGSISLGYADNLGNKGSHSALFRDNQSTSSGVVCASQTYVADVILTSSSRDWRGGGTFTFTPTGFDYTVNDSSPADRATAVVLMQGPPVNIVPTGIASTTALGTPTVTAGAVTVSPTGIASTTALGTPTVTAGAVTVSPAGIASTTALGTPTVTATITLSPPGIASTTALGTPTVTQGGGLQTVSPTGIASTTAMGTPTVTATITVSPTGIASTTSLGTPTVTSTITLSPAGIASTTALGTPTVTAGAVTVSPTGIASTTAMGTPTVAAGAVTVSPTGIASTTAMGTPTVTATITVSPTGIASTTSLGTPTVTATITVSPTGIASTTSLGTPTVDGGTVVLVPTGIASTTSLGTPTVTSTITLSPAGIASTTALGTPTVTSTITLSPGGIASTTALGTPTVTAGAVTVSPAGIASTTAMGTPTVTATITLSPTGIASTTTLGTPTLTAGAVTVSPAGIASTTAMGTPTVVQVGAGLVISVSGIASTSRLGIPFVQGGVIPLTMKKRIYDALCLRAKLGTFIAATYSPDPGCELAQGLQVAPASISINETRDSFRIEGRRGTSRGADTIGWIWLMILRFNEEVIDEPFKAELAEDPICLPRLNNEPDGRQATLFLVDCDYRHPPQGNPSNGSEIRYRFEARLSPL